MYLLSLLIYLLYKKELFNSVLFVEIYIAINSLIYLIFIYKEEAYFNINILIGYIAVTNIICNLDYLGKKILRIHMNFKELQNEKQIRTSLLKITHEIKNPIAVCKGYLDMIDTNNQMQVKKYIPIIKSEIERLLMILQDYLLINKTNMDLDVMDVNMLVEESIEKIKSLLKEKNIVIKNNLLEDEIFINGDYNRLSQVMINILKNSIEAIDGKNGQIIIESMLNKSNYIIKISDNGCGMTKETLRKMKNPFYTTKVSGTGLGVSLIYEIVEAHNGKVEYISEYCKGTQTILSFPIITIEN